jgi:hypothetical protein
MLLNALVAWNLAAWERSPKGKVMLKRYQFMMSVAQSMLNFKDEHDHDSDKPKGHGLKT